MLDTLWYISKQLDRSENVYHVLCHNWYLYAQTINIYTKGFVLDDINSLLVWV